MLPAEVMKKAQSCFVNWNNTGVSVMEVSHRSPDFMALAKKAEQDLRDLMNIPDNYHVLFMHGGGRGQFSAVVNNFLGKKGRALYLISGQWSKFAAEEAQKLAGHSQIDMVDIVVSDDGINHVELSALSGDVSDYRYVHYCPNETVDGIEIFDYIDCPWPVIADMSSMILSREIDVRRFGLIYAGAQKNIGPSGLAIIIVRKDLLQLPSLTQSSIMDYRIAAKNDSMYNTPATYSWYLAGLVFQWLKQHNGVSAIAKVNKQKADLLYQCIDEHPFYCNKVGKDSRSLMNVTFHLMDESLNSEFLAKAKEQGLLALKGHRIVGGMRASIYNAMPLAGVEALVDFMTQFADEHYN